MKALLYNKKQKSFTFSNDAPKPILKPGEISIRVKNVSLNAADYRAMRMGIVPKNRIYGSAISGIIEEVSENCKTFRPGDEVLAELSDHGYGGLAEYAKAPESVVALRPNNLSALEAATLPVAATTALKALRDKGEIDPSKKTNSKVLIVGSSGGVGTFAVQMAKHFGAQVTAVCSSRNVEQSKNLGAIDVIDYTKEDFMAVTEKFDLILAVNGGYSLLGYKRLLNKNGILVTVGGSLAQLFKTMFIGPFLSLGSTKFRVLPAKSSGQDLQIVADLMAEQNIQAVIEKQFSWNEAKTAMEYISAGHASGKVIIYMD